MRVEASPAGCQWSIAAADPASIDLREWDDEYVVYLESQATTHLFDAATGAVLKALLQLRRASSIDELALLSFGAVGDIGESTSPELSADESAALESILLELQRIGLAQAHPS